MDEWDALINETAPNTKSRSTYGGVLDGKPSIPSANRSSTKVSRDQMSLFGTQESELGLDASEDNGLDEFIDTAKQVEPIFYRGCIIGPAGTGKTTKLKNEIIKDPTYGILCATTGIAAINLSSESCQVKTINSLLGYYDTCSLLQSYERGSLVKTLIKLMESGLKAIILDEMSMLGLHQFNVLNRALEEANQHANPDIGRNPLGMILTGDFLQLPPVKDNYCFESSYWKYYDANCELLTTNYRQTDNLFKQALSCARKGNGASLVNALYSHPDIGFYNQVDPFFEGTTIYATNLEVDNHNQIRLNGLIKDGNKPITVLSYRWGLPEQEWSKIPNSLDLSMNSYIMILNNDSEMNYANGSVGHIRDFQDKQFLIELVDNPKGVKVSIGQITRKHYTRYKKEEHGEIEIAEKLTYKQWFAENKGTGRGKLVTYKSYCEDLTIKHRTHAYRPYYDYEKEMMVVGEITFYPLRLAWATTTHKSQGLTLDHVQIDYIGSGRGKGFMGMAGMSYVALSRVRSPKGLRIVGSYKEVERKTNVSSRVVRWI